MVHSLSYIVLTYVLSEKSIYDVMQGDQPPEERINAIDVEKGKELEYYFVNIKHFVLFIIVFVSK